MPTNRRPGSNGQPSVRRPKVAGLRKREGTDKQPSAESAPVEEENTSVEAAAEAAEPARDSEPESQATQEVASDQPGTDVSEPEPETADAEPESGTAYSEGGSETESGTAEPEGDSDSEREPAEESAVDSGEAATDQSGSDGEKSAKGGKSWLLWGATAVLLAAAIVFGLLAYTTYYQGPMANKAMISAGETSEVKGQVEDGVQKLFSYDFKDTAKTEKAAKELLTGDAVKKYNDLFAVVKEQAPKQQLIVTTTVKNSAVTQLQDDRAQVLVFVDQHALRSSTGESNIGPAQLSVTTEKQGDAWKITDLTIR